MKLFINIILATLLVAGACSKKKPIEDPAPSDNGVPKVSTPGAEINKKLGHGINVSGIYEGQPHWNYETNPEIYHGYISEAARLGFQHIRLTVNWEHPERSSETPPYTINPDFMAKVKATVDFALDKGLYVILNMHNHDALMADPDAMKPMFLEQWRQIAWTFRNYSDSLLFEILNEPYSNMTASKWNIFLADALSVIRSTPLPSKNKQRGVLIGVSNRGGPDELRFLKFPTNDPYTILSVHLYYPFWFTHQNTSVETAPYKGTPWNDTKFEREMQRRYTDYVDAYAKLHQIPVNIGEFGAVNEAPNQDRVKYTGFLAKLFTQLGYSWTYFNYHYRWGIYDHITKQYNLPLVEALQDYKSAMPPEHIPAHSAVLYQSNISASNADGWSFSINTGAAAVMNRSSNKITVNIAKGGANHWSVQLSRSGFPIIQGRRYVVSFKASSTVPMQKMLANFTEKEGVASEAYLFYPLEEVAAHYLIFTAQTTQSNGKVTLYMGGNPTNSGVTIEDIQFTEFYD